MSAVLAAAGVRAGYGEREVVRGVDFSVAPGELWADQSSSLNVSFTTSSIEVTPS